MKRKIRRVAAFIKGLILLLRPHFFLGWLQHPLLMTSNIISLSKWISRQDKNTSFNDFFSPQRDYSKRYMLYQHVVDTLGLKNEAIDYLEFGVSQGSSLDWWLKNCTRDDQRFYGFDTFEGLPENWGTFKKGDMSAAVPNVDDKRVEFVKGLFQDTVLNFLSTHDMKTSGKRKILHLDADLFSSTLFVLTSLAPYLKKGDILLFDEFNVPNHEFFAFKMFCDSYYVKTRLLGAVNNYFQVALMIE